MPDYKEMYLTLLRTQNKVIDILQETHRLTEEMYVSAKEPELTLLRPSEADKDSNPPE